MLYRIPVRFSGVYWQNSAKPAAKTTTVMVDNGKTVHDGSPNALTEYVIAMVIMLVIQSISKGCASFALLAQQKFRRLPLRLYLSRTPSRRSWITRS